MVHVDGEVASAAEVVEGILEKAFNVKFPDG